MHKLCNVFFDSDFKIQRRGRQRERQKHNRFYKENNNFALAPRFFVHFFARFCTTTTWTCLISRFMEYVNKQRRNFFIFLHLDMVLRNSTPGGFAYSWQSKWVWITSIKTERKQIHFLSDVLIAVASLDLKVTNITALLIGYLVGFRAFADRTHRSVNGYQQSRCTFLDRNWTT